MYLHICINECCSYTLCTFIDIILNFGGYYKAGNQAEQSRIGWRLVNGFFALLSVECRLYALFKRSDAYLEGKKRGYLLIKMVITLNWLLFAVGKMVRDSFIQ